MTYADKDDLVAALSSSVEGSQDDDFRAVIKDALIKADVGGTRLTFPLMTAWTTRNILDKDLDIGMPRAITDTIVIPYITDEQLPARRNMNVDSENSQGKMIMTQDAQLPNLLNELMDDGLFGTIRNIARMGGFMFERHFCPAIAAVKHYVGMYEYLEEHLFLDFFLYHGAEAGVTTVIQGVKRSDKEYLDTDRISRALRWTFKDGDFDRVACLLVALKKRCEVENEGLEDGEKFYDLSSAVDKMFSVYSRGWHQRTCQAFSCTSWR